MSANAIGPGFAKLAWVVAVLPVVSAALTLFFGKRTPGRGWIYGVAATGAGFVLSVLVLWHFVQGGGALTSSVAWFTIGPLHVELGQFVDGLTAIMLIVVTAVSLAVHVYSIGYMHGDVRFTWFYVVLSLFTAAMLNVVIADNLIQLLVGWEVMGLCSYLLIGHWWEERINSNAAIKAFITTRVGDIPFLFGIFVLVAATGFHSANIQHIGELVGGADVSRGLVSVAALLLFGGTIGKSAQFPLHVWLPDAMQGPTPVSALIHAATMVAAGVYLVGRMYSVFLHAAPEVLRFVGVIGGITMFGAALLALVQDDIKRVLAYSTVSQLAYMVAVMSVGPAGRDCGVLPPVHARVLQGPAVPGGRIRDPRRPLEQHERDGRAVEEDAAHLLDVRVRLGRAGRHPAPGGLLVQGRAAGRGVEGARGRVHSDAATAAVTAFYTTRMVMLTFLGGYRGHGEPQESPAVMTGPLVGLAFGTVTVGFLGAAFSRAVFFKWVFFEVPEPVTFVLWVATLSILAAGLGVLAGWYVYREQPEPDPVLQLGWFSGLLVNKFYLDEVYMNGIVLPVRDRVSAAVVWFDRNSWTAW